MVKLPDHLIQKPKRTLADLQPGQRVSYPMYGVRVDLDHSVYAILLTELEPSNQEQEEAEIWRDTEGAYHLDLRQTKRRFKPEDLTLFRMSTNPAIVPIASIEGIGASTDGK